MTKPKCKDCAFCKMCKHHDQTKCLGFRPKKEAENHKGIFLGGIRKPEKYITLKELRKICKTETMDGAKRFDVIWNKPALNILQAAAKIAKERK